MYHLSSTTASSLPISKEDTVATSSARESVRDRNPGNVTVQVRLAVMQLLATGASSSAAATAQHAEPAEADQREAGRLWDDAGRADIS